MQSRSRVILAMLLFVCVSLTAQQNASGKLRAWIYKKLGIDPKIIQRFTSPKSGGDRRKGARLMSVDLRDEEEHLIWTCGTCWAPAIANSHDIVVLKDDGIWMVSPPEQPRLVVRASGMADILGRIENEPGKLLVITTIQGASESCNVQLLIADLQLGSLQRASDFESECVGSSVGLLHRDELLGTRKLSSTYRNSTIGPALQLLVQNSADSAGSELSPLTPRLDAKDSSEDRFDPIWRTQFEVIYLSGSD